MNQDKLYPCVECGKEVKIRSKGKCSYCRAKELQNSTTVSKPTAPTKTVNRLIQERKNRVHNFFVQLLEEMLPISAESGTFITDFSKKNLCHILPKRIYHSVEEDVMNIVILTWSEHARFDELLDNREKELLLKEFPTVCAIIRERMPYFRDHVTETTGSLFNFLKQLK